MNPKNEVSRGWWLELNDQEERDLMDFLAEGGYTRDKEGIKSFLLDSTYPSEKKIPVVPEMEELLTCGITAVTNLIKKKAGF